MRIRRIELRGFKSFVERTTLQLGPGISGVVGPNGCGKSNVIDAIKWTLGEQSARTLRGAEMKDVIFAGAEGRRPAASAEVTIAFDNSAGAFGGKFARFQEIEVGRRLFRDGGSDYLLNKASCRRKDIVELFLDTGVGARAYSIIEQGRVDFVVQARPEERRVLVDEVAGINRFKVQRAEAERRMAKTRENLVRVADLMTEMGRQRRSLQAQAGRARKYRELRAEWREAALGALVGTGVAHRTKLEEAKGRLRGLKEAEAEAVASLDAAAGESAALRERSAEARRRHEELRDRRAEADAKRQLRKKEVQLRSEELASVTRRLERMDGDAGDLEKRAKAAAKELTSARDRVTSARQELAAAEAALAAATSSEAALRTADREARGAVEAAKAKQLASMTESARAKNQAEMLRRTIAGAEEQLATQAERVAEARARRDEVEAGVASAEEALADAGTRRAELAESLARADASLGAAKSAAKEAEAAVAATRRGHAAAEARLRSLTELIEGLEGFGEGTRAAAEQLGEAVVGTVADLLEPTSEVEPLVELALGDTLQALVVDDPDTAAAALQLESGGVLLVPRASDGSPSPSSLASEVEVAGGAAGLAARLLGDVERGPVEGSVRDRVGVRVGAGGSSSGLLAQRRAARELVTEIEGLAAAVGIAEQSAREAAADVDAANAARKMTAAEGHEAELAELTSRRDLDAARAARDRAVAAIEDADAARARLDASLATTREELAGVDARIAEAARVQAELDAAIEEHRARAVAAEEKFEAATAASTEARVALANAQQATAVASRDLRRLEADAADAARRRDRAASDRATAEARKVHLADTIAAGEAEHVALVAELETLAGEVEAAAAAREETSRRWQRAEDGLRSLRSAVETVRRDLGTVEVTCAEARTALAGARARAAEQFDLDLEPVLKDLVVAPADVDRVRVELPSGDAVLLLRDRLTSPEAVAAWSEAATRTSAKIDALGPVNLAADDEFREVDARYSELESQRTDLESALADLKRAIAKIQQETRERFGEAFQRVNERFAALYPRLVGGGRAELRLTDPNDLLGTGIDIDVEPPGKRLQNLTLLSGGEKAMAAIALVFAIFQVKPSPFCLLDEVDAPLDDSNARRMGEMLREMAAETQFVVITHNRATMEIADVLYGVTMQRPGISTVVSVRMD